MADVKPVKNAILEKIILILKFFLATFKPVFYVLKITAFLIPKIGWLSP